jgi:hypothetical protein
VGFANLFGAFYLIDFPLNLKTKYTQRKFSVEFLAKIGHTMIYLRLYSTKKINMHKSTYRPTHIIAIFILSLCACNLLQPSAAPDDVAEVSTEIVSSELTTGLAPADLETATLTPVATSTPIPMSFVEETQTVLPEELGYGLIDRLCPQLTRPLGVFKVPEMYRDPKNEDGTVFELYQIKEISTDPLPDFCTLFISPFPLGGFHFAGDTVFWQSYDSETEFATIWQYDTEDKLTDEADPQHIELGFTEIHTPPSFLGLISFLVSGDGSSIVWSRTEPKLNEENQYVYLQEIYMGGVDGSYINELWFNVAIEINGLPRIIRLRELSDDNNILYYSEEPVGLGTNWPYPLGRYSTLFSMPTWGEMPTLHFDCEGDHWCISDFSAEHDLVVYFQNTTITLTTFGRDKMAEITPEEPFSLLRQAMIGPDDSLVFLALQSNESGDFNPPSEVAIYHVEPPFDGEPVLILRDAALRNIVGWIDADTLLLETIFTFEDSGGVESDNLFTIVHLVDRSSELLNLDISGFELLLP